MKNPEPNVRIPVDLTNPGQFFACCGLLELASRIEPESVGWFDGSEFIIAADVPTVLGAFFECEVDVRMAEVTDDAPQDDDDNTLSDSTTPEAHRHRIAPMQLRSPFDLRLDWWNCKDTQDQKLKTWSAGQRVTDLLLSFRKGKRRIPSMRDHVADVVRRFPHDWLRAMAAISEPGAFSYDSRLSRNNALDLGHTDVQTFAFSPAVDVLTLVALQRFRPLMVRAWARNQYHTWRDPLSVQVAAPVAVGAIPQLADRCYEFPIKPRDAQGRYKLFGHAQLQRSANA